MKTCSGILVPGAFGNRGIEGMILAAGDDVPTPVFAEGANPGDRVR